jgi:transcriptional regulator with XRE-family HTH domain
VKEFGARIRKLREGVQLSQAKIAKLIGTSQVSINRYESGGGEPPLKTLIWYADYFDVSLDYLLARTDNPQGKLYDFQPEVLREKMASDKEWQQFVEMCFDPNSPMSTRLKEAMMQMVGDKK